MLYSKIFMSAVKEKNASLLLHMDGTNDSTVFTDSGPAPKLITAHGNAKISTTQSKFGGASAYFDGNNSYLSVADRSSFDLKDKDFTIEAWIYPTSLNDLETIFSCYGGPRYGAYILRIENSRLHFYVYPSVDLHSIASITLNKWSHVAVTRSKGTFMLFLDGILVGSMESSSILTADEKSDPAVGVYFHPFGQKETGSYFSGYIDELKITDSFANYTSDFTLPTAPFTSL